MREGILSVYQAATCRFTSVQLMSSEMLMLDQPFDHAHGRGEEGKGVGRKMFKSGINQNRSVTQNKSLKVCCTHHLQSQIINVTKLPSWISNYLKLLEMVLAQLRKICNNLFFLEIVSFDKSISQKCSYYSNDESCQDTKLI